MGSYVKFNECLKVDYVKIDTKMLTTIENAQLAKDQKNSYTVLHSDFSGQVDAFYFMPSVFNSNSCHIYRKTPSQNYYDYIYSLRGAISLNDYNIHNNDDYEYMAVIAIEQHDGSFLYQIYENRDDNDNKILTHIRWDSWSICNIEPSANSDSVFFKTGTTWLLGLNINDVGLNQNIGVTSWDTLGKYPKISSGEKNYESANVTCLLGQMKEVVEDIVPVTNSYYDPTKENITCETEDKILSRYRYTERNNVDDRYGREVEKLNAWREFCSDGELKLLRDIKGNSWIVQIVENPSHTLTHGSAMTPTTISFTWQEVMDIHSVSIITEGD